ncbi:MAG: hypothetical protein JW809_02050 [Pirellulales bacterium]|nr:hypothetical protein [Pirellulales bacterium]
MDPFRLCLAIGPVAVYLVLLGLVNLGRRPLVVSGARDAAALSLAVAGLVFVGPIELFFPETAAIRFGVGVWAFLVALYGLCVTFVLLTLRPRLVVYNVSVDELRPILAELVEKLDGEGRWAGDSLSLPNLGVHLHVEAVPSLRNVTLASSGPRQDYVGWRKLELALAEALGGFTAARNVACLSLLSAGVVLLVLLGAAVVRDPQRVAQSMLDMFTR